MWSALLLCANVLGDVTFGSMLVDSPLSLPTLLPEKIKQQLSAYCLARTLIRDLPIFVIDDAGAIWQRY